MLGCHTFGHWWSAYGEELHIHRRNRFVNKNHDLLDNCEVPRRKQYRFGYAVLRSQQGCNENHRHIGWLRKRRFPYSQGIVVWFDASKRERCGDHIVRRDRCASTAKIETNEIIYPSAKGIIAIVIWVTAAAWHQGSHLIWYFHR